MKQCFFCEKKSMRGGVRVLLRGNYNPTSSPKKQANLQWLKNPLANGRVKACVRCIKTVTKKGVR